MPGALSKCTRNRNQRTKTTYLEAGRKVDGVDAELQVPAAAQQGQQAQHVCRAAYPQTATLEQITPCVIANFTNVPLRGSPCAQPRPGSASPAARARGAAAAGHAAHRLCSCVPRVLSLQLKRHAAHTSIRHTWDAGTLDGDIVAGHEGAVPAGQRGGAARVGLWRAAGSWVGGLGQQQ